MYRLGYIAVCIILGWIAAHYGSPFVEKNDALAPLLVTIFTVFAGFMVAVIVILGDPLLLPPGSWQGAENERPKIEARLIRHMYLFFVYLIAIAAIFLSVLLKNAPNEQIPELWKRWIEWTYVWLSVTAFLLSFAMPKMLMDSQRDRVDKEIIRRRKEENIKS